MDDSTSRAPDGVVPDRPFIDFREKLDTYRQAREQGWSDADYVDLVDELDRSLVTDGGVGFRTTPLVELGFVDPRFSTTAATFAKVETGNVGGSHKARHLFGLLIQTAIEERSACNDGGTPLAPLAIASCGNAALGAAVVARAVGRRLLVFVPAVADAAVIRDLDRLGAEIEVCHRVPGETGDPCVLGLDRAIGAGARPFTVQGTICPGVIDGGRTLGLELAEQLTALGCAPTDLYIQIGGGALASAVVDGLDRSGRLTVLPRLHPVQPAAAHPYVAAWRRIRPALIRLVGAGHHELDDRDLAPRLADPAHGSAIDIELDRADDVMQPWPGEPISVATGILDDVTYDWKTVLRHQCRTGGWPVLVDESVFVRAQRESARLLHDADPSLDPADATGAAGFAGLLSDSLRRDTDGPVVVIASGRIRS